MATLVWEMHGPSTGLLREPKLQVLTRRSCCLWWVAEKEAGGGKIEALLFMGVEAYKTTYRLAYSAEMVRETYDDLVDLGQTKFLSEIESNLRAYTAVEDLRHFAISFDGGPLYEFIARNFQFQSPFDVSDIELDFKVRIASCINPLATDRSV